MRHFLHVVTIFGLLLTACDSKKRTAAETDTAGTTSSQPTAPATPANATPQRTDAGSARPAPSTTASDVYTAIPSSDLEFESAKFYFESDGGHSLITANYPGLHKDTSIGAGMRYEGATKWSMRIFFFKAIKYKGTPIEVIRDVSLKSDDKMNGFRLEPKGNELVGKVTTKSFGALLLKSRPSKSASDIFDDVEISATPSQLKALDVAAAAPPPAK